MKKRGYRSTANLLKAINRARHSDSRNKGFGNEDFILQLTKEIAAANQIPVKPCAIYRTSTFSKLDIDGVDIVIPTDKGEIPLQVKSSITGARIFQKQRPDILCIAATRTKSRTNLKEELCVGILAKYNEL